MNAPTLIVGLGGAGTKIVSRVTKLVSEEQRKNISFVVIDTDANELNSVVREYPSAKAIQISDRMQVGEYLWSNPYARDVWFPVNNILNSKVATEGAGQVRAISRLIFERAIEQGKMRPLLDAIRDLYTLTPDMSAQALRVIIVSSLAGGTGSGLLLPVAMFIKKHLDNHYIENAAIIRGFFLLPEIFDLVIAQDERRVSMRSNAYAALREIDAFLMAGDNSLDQRFRDSVVLEMPKAGVPGSREAYNVRPFDFCFLFDAQNASGQSLLNHEMYLNHAANCIYAQAIGPTNKRSNSSEDNTIRSMVAESGRNRYAGAGSARLVYPTQSIQEYIALHWAQASITDQWLKFDRQYRESVESRRQRQKSDSTEKDLDPVAEYIRLIDMDESGFGAEIRDAFQRKRTDGSGEISSNASTEFIHALMAKVEADSAKVAHLAFANKTAKNQLTGLSSDDVAVEKWGEIASLFVQMEKYYKMADAHVVDEGKYIARAMFNYTASDVAEVKEKYRVEHYLSNNAGNFVHPNAARYFLCKCVEDMKTQKRKVHEAVLEAQEYIRSFEEKKIGGKDDSGAKGTAASLGARKLTLMERLKNKTTDSQRELLDALGEYLKMVNKYHNSAIFEEVLEEGIAYLQKIIKAFNDFYASFELMVDGLDARKEAVASRYADGAGTTVRYVCASPTCMKELAESLVYTGSAINPDSALCSGIYQRIREYALMKERPQDNEYFSDIFEKNILGFFIDSIMEKYGNLVDMDIIDALQREAQIVCKGKDKDDIERWMAKIVEESRSLATPFIEKPRCKAFDVIDACTYNRGMTQEAEKLGGFKRKFIKTYLGDKGGESDEEIGKNEIVFYQAFYGLRANALSKFAPPENTLTLSRDGGEYYTAYYDIVRELSPNCTESKVVSPHLDRWWHLVSKMPDLDERNQVLLEQRNYAAFFWGLVAGYFTFTPKNHGGIYTYAKQKLNMTSGSGYLTVSNGTDCDHLYEVLDAISIYPELADRIMERVDNRIQKDIDSGADFELRKGYLPANIAKFRIEEYPIYEQEPAAPGERPTRRSCVRSIFDIPVLMRRSVTPEMMEYFEDTALDVLGAMLDEVERYLRSVCVKEELNDVMSRLIVEQFELFVHDMQIEKEQMKIRYFFKSALFTNMKDKILSTLERLDHDEDVDYLNEIVDALE